MEGQQKSSTKLLRNRIFNPTALVIAISVSIASIIATTVFFWMTTPESVVWQHEIHTGFPSSPKPAMAAVFFSVLSFCAVCYFAYVVAQIASNIVREHSKPKGDQTWTQLQWHIPGLLFVYLFLGFLPFFVAGIPDDLKAQELGDAFGVANAFFSALAFGGVIVAIFLQMRELQDQKHEMVEMQRVQLCQARVQFLQNKPEVKMSSEEQMELSCLVDNLKYEAEEYLRQNSSMPFQAVLHGMYNGISTLQMSDWIGAELHSEHILDRMVAYEDVKYKCYHYLGHERFGDVEKGILSNLILFVTKMQDLMRYWSKALSEKDKTNQERLKMEFRRTVVKDYRNLVEIAYFYPLDKETLDEFDEVLSRMNEGLKSFENLLTSMHKE